MAVVYQHLKSPKNTSSGVSDAIFMAPVSWFDTIQCADPEDPAATLGTATHISTPHTFAAGKGFIEVICAPFKNKLDGATIGEIGSTSFDVNLSIFVPGSHNDLDATIATLKNQPLIALVKDGNCANERYYQLGCDCKFAWMSAQFSTGEGKSGQKGYQITINAVADAIMTYSGSVTKLPPPVPPEEG